jgi:hypothetical protein
VILEQRVDLVVADPAGGDLVRDEVTADIVRWLATLPSGEPAGSTPG